MRKILPALLLLVFVLTACGPANVHITHGKYQKGVYTPPMSNFTCDFGSKVEEGDSPTTLKLYDKKEDDFYGAVWGQADYGWKYAVDYYRISALSPERQALFADTANRQTALEEFFVNSFVIAQQNYLPGLTVLQAEFVSDNVLFALFDQPKGSILFDNSTNTHLDAIAAYYITADNEWLYMVSYQRAENIFGFAPMEPEAYRNEVETFYSQCKFGN